MNFTRDSLRFLGTVAVLGIATLATATVARNAASRAKVLGGATKVSDIRTTSPATRVSDPVVANGVLYFAADDGVGGAELWKSDGSELGTRKVKEIRPGPASALNVDTASLTAVGSNVFMAATNELAFTTLWRSDGTEAGTLSLGAGNPTALKNVDGALYFSGEFEGREPWRSDGTVANTRLIKDVATFYVIPESKSGLRIWYSSDPRDFVSVGGTVYFSASGGYSEASGSYLRELWKTDGTDAGTVLVKDIRSGGSSDPRQLVNLNGTLVFTADDGTSGVELWKSDGTEAGTVRITDLNPGAAGSNPDNLVVHGGTLYFSATNGVDGIELWKSDGTAAGTVQVKDINPGATGSSPQKLASLNGSLYFTADDGSSGIELWKSDGTAAGTVRVRDINAGASASTPRRLTEMGGLVYFVAEDGAGAALWRTDGSDAGTVKAVANFPVLGFPDGGALTVLGGAVYFAGADPAGGTELWRSDGTQAGTRMVRDVNPGSGSRGLGNLAAVGGSLFFTADGGSGGVELWSSDGTAAGTAMVRDLLANGDANPNNLVAFNGKLLFAADGNAVPSSRGTELWMSDGSAAGTTLLAEINTGWFAYADHSSSPAGFTRMNGALYFSAHQECCVYTDTELWKTDGTTAGTVMVKDIAGGAQGFGRRILGSYPRDLTPVSGTLFFSALDELGGRELWKSDGSEAGTIRVRDIVGGASGSDPRHLVGAGGTLYFVADDGASGAELWKSDGTEAGTVRVKDIVAGAGSSNPANLVNLAGKLLFTADDGSSGVELWASDGTAAGTVRVKDINPTGSSDPSHLVVVGGTLFFAATDGASGVELWKSDGTSAGTLRVKDIAPGIAGSQPEDLANIYGALYFTADDGANGRELWRSDGSEAGTVLVADINPGPGSSYPREIVAVGDKLFFTAFDGTAGRGLWVVPADYGPGGIPVDIMLSMAAAPRPAIEGQNVVFTLTARNNGPASTSATINAAVPAGATFVSAASPCAASAGQISCPLGSIAPGASATVTVTLRRAAPGILNLAAVAVGTSLDPIPADNEAALPVNVLSAAVNLPRLVNLSTRARVLTGDEVLIGGFIIGGSASKTVVVRARGTSMESLVVNGLLQNPKLELYSGQTVIASNDDWQASGNAAQLQTSGFAPPKLEEASVLVTLAPGPYTVVVSGGPNPYGGVTGLGLVEIFEVDHPEIPLVNIATRGRVGTDADVMIAGFIIQGNGQQSVVVRARGPSLASFGIANLLADPKLTLVRSSDGAVIATNDNWQTAPNAFDVNVSGFAPANPLEAAILIKLDPGAYTAIVGGAGNTTGVAIVEVFRN